MSNSIPEYLKVRITESKAESMSYVATINLYKLFRDSVFLRLYENINCKIVKICVFVKNNMWSWNIAQQDYNRHLLVSRKCTPRLSLHRVSKGYSALNCMFWKIKACAQALTPLQGSIPFCHPEWNLLPLCLYDIIDKALMLSDYIKVHSWKNIRSIMLFLKTIFYVSRELECILQLNALANRRIERE